MLRPSDRSLFPPYADTLNIRPRYVPWLAHPQWPMFLPMLMQATAYVRSHANVTNGLSSSLCKYWPMSPAKITTLLLVIL